MNEELQRRCDLFLENRSILRETFQWDSSTMALAGSTVFTGMNRKADADTLKRCEKILVNHSSCFSELRGNLKLPLICKMSVAKDPERYFSDVNVVDQMLNSSKWLGNSHMLLASMVICDDFGAQDAQVYVDKTNEIYRCMKESHRWLTSDEDIPFAAMLAVSGMDVERLIAESERCYPILKDKFGVGSGNVVQTLSHILALGEKSADDKCVRVAKIYDLLKAEKHKIEVGQELASLGMLAVLDTDVETIVEEVIEVDNDLKPHQGFGDWDAGSSARRMYAAMIVAALHRQSGTAAQQGADTLAVSVAIEVCTAVMMILLF